ncbi:MAG: hypothetical protein LQ351_000636 [Letrouitia transgressa]|nr:MAG: hypothetical protein LQ351_000636 [Letrouitia transgressa]
MAYLVPRPPPPKTAYLPLEQPTAAPPAPSAYLPLERPTPAIPAPPDHHPVESVALSAYLPVKPTQPFSSSPFDASEGAYLLVVSGPTGGVSAAKEADDAYLAASNADSGHNPNIQVAGGNEPTRGGAAAVIPAAGITRGAGGNSVEFGLNTKYFSPTPRATISETQTRGPFISAGMSQITSRTIPGGLAGPSTGEINGVTYSIGGAGAIINGKTFSFDTPTTAAVASDKIVVVAPSGSVLVKDLPVHESPPQLRKSVTPKEYVSGAFLPTVLAVLFSIPWHILFAAIQEMEPFYQLTHPQGALARDSICLDYRASLNVVATVKAGLRGHFVVLCSGLCSIFALALPPLASETVFIGFIGKGRCTATSSRDVCNPQLSVYPAAARVVQGILGLLAVLTICIAITRRSSGVYSNPLSIAGTAALFQNSTFVDEFRELDSDDLNRKTLEARLKGNRYRLGHFQHCDGFTDYGISKYKETMYKSESESNVPLYGGSIDNNKKNHAYASVTPVNETPRPKNNKQSISGANLFVHPATISLFACLVVGLLVLVIYYNRTGGNTPFERFMDSQSFGVTSLFTGMGVLLKMYWSALDDDLRTTEPYRLLVLGSPPPGAMSSVLATPPSNPFTGLFHSVKRRAWLPAWMSGVAILTEPLIVALANVPFHAGTAHIAYRVSTYVVIGVLSLMLLGIVGLLVRSWESWSWSWSRSGEDKGGRRTMIKWGMEAARDRAMGRRMGLVCGSWTLEMFRGTAEMTGRKRDDVVEGWGIGWHMGQVVGVDGVERWGVDESMNVKD